MAALTRAACCDRPPHMKDEMQIAATARSDMKEAALRRAQLVASGLVLALVVATYLVRLDPPATRQVPSSA